MDKRVVNIRLEIEERSSDEFVCKVFANDELWEEYEGESEFEVLNDAQADFLEIAQSE